jgi:hypothetical protein
MTGAGYTREHIPWPIANFRDPEAIGMMVAYQALSSSKTGMHL